jgi:tetratricopeptide (TPR) repeat protein
MRGLIILFSLLISVQVFAQTERKYIRKGNKEYESQKYSDAELEYRKALDKKPKSFEAAFNVGNSLYKQGKYPEAAVQFDTLAKTTRDKEDLANLYYNLGNSYLKSKKLDESIGAYKNSLKINPKDNDAKFNLAYAQKMLKQQKDQQKQNDKNKDKKDKDKKDKNKQDQKDQQNKDKQNKNQDQNKQQQPKQQQISPEDAQRMLEAVQNDEKNVQKRLQEQKNQGQKSQVLKNW